MTSVHFKAPLAEKSLSQRPKVSRTWWIIAFAISATLLYVALRGVDWGQVGGVLRHADIGRLAMAAAVMTLSLMLRAVRWRVVLTADPPLRVGTVFWATCLGYAGNNLLPARAGEIVRSVIISAKSNLSKSFVLTTALAERTIDAVFLVPISTLALGIMPGIPRAFSQASRVLGFVAVAGILGIVLVGHIDALLAKIVVALPISHKLRERIQQVQAEFVAALLAFRHRGRALAFSGLTLVIWSCDTMVALLLASTLHLKLHPAGAVILVAALGLSSALPSTPGYLGVYQFVAVSVLVPLGMTRSEALAFIFLFQFNNYLVICGWAALGMWRLQKDGEPVAAASVGPQLSKSS